MFPQEMPMLWVNTRDVCGEELKQRGRHSTALGRGCIPTCRCCAAQLSNAMRQLKCVRARPMCRARRCRVGKVGSKVHPHGVDRAHPPRGPPRWYVSQGFRARWATGPLLWCVPGIPVRSPRTARHGTASTLPLSHSAFDVTATFQTCPGTQPSTTCQTLGAGSLTVMFISKGEQTTSLHHHALIMSVNPGHRSVLTSLNARPSC